MVAAIRAGFVRHLEKVVADVMQECKRADREASPACIAARVAEALWEEASPDAHPCPPDWIKHVRGSMGLSQNEFAARLGTTQVTVARWESGRMAPGPMQRHRIEEIARSIGAKRRGGSGR